VQLPLATNTAGVTAVTMTTDINLQTLGIAAGDLFKYLGKPPIYTVASVGGAQALTLNEKIVDAHTGEPFGLFRPSTTYKLYLPEDGDPDWADLINHSILILDEKVALSAAPVPAVLSIKTADDDRYLGPTGNPPTYAQATNIAPTFDEFPRNNSNALMRPFVTTGAGVTGRSHINVGMKVHLGIRTDFAVAYDLKILLYWGIGSSPSVWTLLQGYTIPATIWVLKVGTVGHIPSWEFSVEEIFTGLSPSTTYTFKADISALGSLTAKVHLPDTTFPATRKFWAIYYE